MTKEQAIEILKSTLEMTKPPLQEEITRQDILNDGYYYYTEEDLKAIETILNMLKEKDKEIKKLEKQSRNLDKEAQQYFETTIKQSEQFEKELEKKNKMIDDAINFIQDNCLEEIADMKGCYRETASVGDLQELINILKGK